LWLNKRASDDDVNIEFVGMETWPAKFSHMLAGWPSVVNVKSEKIDRRNVE